ncbi:MAG: ROK family protein [Ornithinimicrobium sp.]
MNEATRHRSGADNRVVPMSSARQESLRAHNLTVISRMLFASSIPMSRADLAERTGMTRSTVSRLVDDLLAGGVLQEGLAASGGSRGRPATPLSPAAGSFFGLGLEVNVDFLAARVVDLTGQVYAERLVPGHYRGADPADTLVRVGDLGREVVQGLPPMSRLAGTVLALPGLIRSSDQRLLLAPNLEWRDLPTVSALGDLAPLGRSVTAVNEAKAAALASVATPEGMDHNGTFIYVSGGIGIGAALVVGGEVDAGSHGWGGEIGHVTIEPQGPLCGCGAHGCLEQYAGKFALSAGVEGLSTGELIEAACAEPGPQAQRVRDAVERAGWALGVGLAAAINVTDIHHVILGGTFAELAPRLLPVIERELDERVLSSEWSWVGVLGASTGIAPAATGGALQALQTVISDPASWM